MIYGYARVSSKDQNEARQVIALREAGVEDTLILVEKQSGKDFERPMYKYLMRKLKPGDVLFIKSIDRLGRNYDEILEQWRAITKKKKAAIVVLDMPLLDTRQRKDGDLTGAFIADLVLQILAYVAQTEREFNRQRQAEGIAAAKARGVRFGRRPLERPQTYEDVLKAYKAMQCTAREAAAELGVAHTTFLRWSRADGVRVDSTAGRLYAKARRADNARS